MADSIFGAAWGQLDPILQMFIFIIALCLGAILTFAGKLLWKPFMLIVGGFIGSIVGFALGFLFGGIVGGLIGAMLGGAVGGTIFAIVVKSALAALAGIISFTLIEVLTRDAFVALIIGFVVFVASVIFIEGVIGILTAILGALIVGVCLMGLGIDIGFAAIAALILMIAGSLIQTIFVKDRTGRPRQARMCPNCRGPLRHSSEIDRWYCPNCGSNPMPPPPTDR
jgi:ribosomal protein S27AE